MSKDIEKKGHPVIITLTTLAALAGLIRLILKIVGDDKRWEN
jgi:hypothetical protein